MKKIVSLIGLLLFCMHVFAQWVSPGTGTTYTLSSLSTVAPTVVSNLQNGQYQIHQNLTISAGDVLNLESSAQSVLVDDTVDITIYGSLTVEPRSSLLLIQGDSTGNDPFQLFLDSAIATTISQVHFSYCYQVLLSQTDMIFDQCEFSHCANSGINYMNCNPTIRDCYFYENQRAAISSAVNMQGSPQIINNVLYNNDLSNANVPQINIGPGAEDTIRIVNNTIQGLAQDMSGGIGLMSLGSGQTKILVQGNLITHNRYGYTQNGTGISAVICNNIIQDNDLETNANNGGSGISIYGYDTTNRAKIRRNLISGNLWGVTAIYYHAVDMGTADDPGENVLFDNGNNDTEYELYNNAFSDMNALGNYWGDNDSAHAEAVIFHGADAAGYGMVTYSPIMQLEPEILSLNFLYEDNPESEYPGLESCYQTSFVGEDTILIEVDATLFSSYFDNIVPALSLPLGVSCSPDPNEAQDFTQSTTTPFIYTLTTPHGSSKVWNVLFQTPNAVPQREVLPVVVSPNPAVDNHIQLLNESGVSVNIEVYALTGQLLYFGQSSESRIHISTNGWERGIYTVRVSQGQQSNVIKVVLP